MTTLAPLVCFITPRLPPAMDGLGDYCRQLWENWSQANDYASRPPWKFLVLDGAQVSSQGWGEVDIQSFDPSRTGLLEGLKQSQAQICVLQYVGYAYDREGIPLWLPEALQEWKLSDRRVVIMFHETWAQGRPWEKVFWQTGAQKQCAAKLLDLSSIAVTSNSACLRDLKNLDPQKPVEVIPIGCSFPITKRETLNWQQLLIMGKESSRLRALRVHKQLIMALAGKGLISKLVVAGEAQDKVSDQSKQLLESWKLPVEIIGSYNFSRNDLPAVVKQSGISLMHTETTCLLKSTSFQLAAQLGQVAISRQEGDPGVPFVRGIHYLSYEPAAMDDLLSQISNTNNLTAVSQAVSDLGRTYLSWGRIVNEWRSILSEMD